MAFPLILIGIAALSGVVGGKKAWDASEKTDQAERTYAEIDEIVSKANALMKEAREQSDASLASFARMKIDAMQHTLPRFLREFKYLKHVDFRKHRDVFDALHLPSESFSFDGMQRDVDQVNHAMTAGGGLAGSALVTAGAYGAVMYGGFATASTGAAISGLSGAAATNATLAWFGGGSLASGGLGVAGGTAVLGGLIVGPAIFLGGMLWNHAAEEKLCAALTQKDEAVRFQKNINQSVILLRALADHSKILQRALSHLKIRLAGLVQIMKADRTRYGGDFERYNRKAQENVMMAAVLAQLIKGIIDTPLLDEKGNLSTQGKRLAESCKDVRALERPQQMKKALSCVERRHRR